MICGFDCETQGFDLSTDRMTELGAVVFNPATMERLHTVSSLVWEPWYKPQPEEIVEVTGITDDMLKADGVPFTHALMLLDQAIGSVGGISHFLAHNADFDRRAFHAELKKHSDKIPKDVFDRYIDIPWLCSLHGIKHPAKFKSRKLAHLALDYGVPVDPRTLHRASADVGLMLDMLVAAKVNLQEMIELSGIPEVIIRAMVPPPFGPRGDNGKGKDKAKACGFGWQKAPGTDGPVVELAWLKKVRENEIEKEQEDLGYKVVIVSGKK